MLLHQTIALMLLYQTIAFTLGYILDLMFGDPQWFPHPVRLIGTLISKTEQILRRIFHKSEKKELFAGGILVAVVVTISTVIPFFILGIAYWFGDLIGVIIEAFLCYTLLATKSLKDESMKVYHALQQRDLEGGRYFVSRIVGRDTKNLTVEGVTKATVETIAENTSDGIVAPFFYMALGGATLGFFYKAINTMDSMVGYKNEKYLYFGRCAAKLDDVVNYIPARLSAVLMVLASMICKFSYKNAWKIYKRDCRNHASPNSAHTEAVCAGALSIQLAGDAYYFGKLYKKPTIGEPIRPIQVEDIRRANRLLYVTSMIMLLLVIIIRVVIIILL